jgi:hypothetical protein
MIIKYPTGLYKSQMDDFVANTNVTYNISNNPPPRSNIIFQKIPDGIAFIKLTKKKKARSDLGQLIFTTSSSYGGVIQNGIKLKNIGEYIEFGDVLDVGQSTPVAPDISDITHNISYPNYEQMGLNQDEVTLINSEILIEFDKKTLLLNSLKSQLKDTKNSIQNSQKQINALNNSISALVLIGSKALNDIIDRLEAQSIALQLEMNGLQDLERNLNSEITTETGSINALGGLLK